MTSTRHLASLVHAALVAALVSGCGSSSPGESADPTGSPEPSTSASASGSSSPSPSESASATEDETGSAADPNAGTPFEGVKPARGRKVEMNYGTFRLPPGWVSPEGGKSFKIPMGPSGNGCRLMELTDFGLTMNKIRRGRHDMMSKSRDMPDFVWGGHAMGQVTGRTEDGLRAKTQLFTIPEPGVAGLVFDCNKYTPEPWRQTDIYSLLASWRWKQ